MVRPVGKESLDGRGTKYETDVVVKQVTHSGFAQCTPAVLGSIHNAVG